MRVKFIPRDGTPYLVGKRPPGIWRSFACVVVLILLFAKIELGREQALTKDLVWRKTLPAHLK